jgi:uncharacterized protein YndB with AHSA1/START domain
MEKEKVVLEYLFKSPPNILYSFINTQSGLADWFCDNTEIDEDIYTFFWGDSQEEARLLEKSKEHMRWIWLYDEDEDAELYFEFRIVPDNMTNEVALVITDFCEEDEIEEFRMLWDKQLEKLKLKLGA